MPPICRDGNATDKNISCCHALRFKTEKGRHISNAGLFLFMIFWSLDLLGEFRIGIHTKFSLIKPDKFVLFADPDTDHHINHGPDKP